MGLFDTNRTMYYETLDFTIEGFRNRLIRIRGEDGCDPSATMRINFMLEKLKLLQDDRHVLDQRTMVLLIKEIDHVIRIEESRALGVNGPPKIKSTLPAVVQTRREIHRVYLKDGTFISYEEYLRRKSERDWEEEQLRIVALEEAREERRLHKAKLAEQARIDQARREWEAKTKRCKECSKFIKNDGRNYCDKHYYMESTAALAKKLRSERKRREKVEIINIDTRGVDVPSEFEERVGNLVKSIDPTNSQSIIMFGTEANAQVGNVTTELIKGIKARDVGVVGESITDMVETIQAFRPAKKRNILSIIMDPFGGKNLLQYDQVDVKIEDIVKELESHRDELIVNLDQLDDLCNVSVVYHREISLHIVAARRVLAELKQQLASLDSDDGMDSMLEVHRLEDAIRALEQRIVDMSTVATTLKQDVVSVVQQQRLDRSTISKIQGILEHTVTLWRQQVAKAMMMDKSRKASAATKAASDLTAELVEENAENLLQTSKEVVREATRELVDIEAVEKANNKLIEALEDARTVFKQRGAKHEDILNRLKISEDKLKHALIEEMEASGHKPEGTKTGETAVKAIADSTDGNQPMQFIIDDQEREASKVAARQFTDEAGPN